MSDQPASGNNNNNRAPGPDSRGPNNNSRRHHNQRRRPQDSGARPQQQGPGLAPSQQQAQNQAPQQQAQAGQNRDAGGGGQRRRPNRNNNRPRNPNQAPNPNQNQNSNTPHGINIERIYEKYLNLLDQHLIARRKYHDLFYRADPGQKNKLERNFYNTLADIRDFENKLAPEARELFEKRNNGLSQDNIYTTNHEIAAIGDNPPPLTELADPHFLHSQKIANYKEDKEESMGSLDDYLKYKNLI